MLPDSRSPSRSGSELEGGQPPRPALARESVAIALLLLGMAAVCYFDVVLLGKTLRAANLIASTLPTGHFGAAGAAPSSIPLYDVTPGILEEPYQEFKQRSLARGELPLWNPHQAGGYPFLATMESSLFFLPELVLYAAPDTWSWDLYFLVRLLLAGIATHALLRLLGCERIGAASAAVAYAFSGPVVAWIANVTLNADALLPLLLVTLELALRSDRRLPVVAAAVVVFQIVAGGHPEHTFLALLSGALYAGCRIAEPGFAARRGVPFGRVALAFGAGLGLSAVQLLPFVEYLVVAWHVHSEGTGLQALRFTDAATVLFPWYDSRELVSIAGFTPRTWPGGWLGVATVTLALSTFFLRPRLAAARPFQLLALFYVAKLFGVPPISWLGHLPPFDLVKFPLHGTQNLAFATAALAGVAISTVARRERAERALVAGLGATLAVAVALVLLRRPQNSALTAFGVAVAVAALLALLAFARARGGLAPRTCAAGVALVLAAELALLVPRERARRVETFREPPYVAFLKRDRNRFRVFGVGGCLHPNTATAFGLDDLGIYEGLFVGRFARFVHALVDRQAFGDGSFHAFRGGLPDPGNRILDLANLKYLIAPKDVQLPAETLARFHLSLVYDREVRIVRRERALPRATVRTAADFVPDGKSALARLAAGYDFERRVLVEGSAPLADRGGEAGEPGEVEELEYGLHRKRYRVRCAGNCYLVVADVHYPGWRARVDGRNAELLRADYLFQGVALPAGEHEVTLDFRPASVRRGATISLATFALLVLWWRQRAGPLAGPDPEQAE
jgi:hypothetical protein